MGGMFQHCILLEEIDVSNFNTRNLEDISSMFYMCKSLNRIDLSNFDTRKISNYREIFFYSSNLHYVDISSFQFSSNIKIFNGLDSVGVVKVNNIIEYYIRDQVPSGWMVIVNKN